MDRPISDGMIDAMLSWWRAEAAKTDMDCPDWSAFDPIEHPRILPWIAVFKRQDNGHPEIERNYTCVIAGEGLDTIVGENYRGRYFGELITTLPAEAKRRELLDIIESREPKLHTLALPRQDREFIQIARMILPFMTGDHVGAVVIMLREMRSGSTG